MHVLARHWIDEVLGKSPFAVMLGIEVAEAEPDRVLVRLPFRPELATVGAIVHGGAIATLVDIAGAAASGSGIDEDDVTGGATSQMDVAYLVAADGCDLVAEARVIQRSKSQTVSDVFVRDDTGRLVAKGMVTSRIFRKRA
ncbi:MAG TPA: PaaI family thioesterase [Rhizobiaceae bacterium]|nr:PaaI family thioesterase [Rhizobiaceae bacterium]